MGMRGEPFHCFRSSPTSTTRDSACHPKGRSAAEDPRSGLTRGIARRSGGHRAGPQAADSASVARPIARNSSARARFTSRRAARSLTA